MILRVGSGVRKDPPSPRLVVSKSTWMGPEEAGGGRAWGGLGSVLDVSRLGALKHQGEVADR